MGKRKRQARKASMWVRGHDNILKRVLPQACALNLGLLMRQLAGIGTPRSFKDASHRFCRSCGCSFNFLSACLTNCCVATTSATGC